MAAELVRVAKCENKGEPERLRFYYYTAGTGGAGPTILATSFLLLGEEVVAYNKGEKIKLRPYSGMVNIDFGKGIGKKDVYLLNLPEVTSAHEVLGVPTVSARFGTAPFIWNWAMDAMTRFLPSVRYKCEDRNTFFYINISGGKMSPLDNGPNRVRANTCNLLYGSKWVGLT